MIGRYWSIAAPRDRQLPAKSGRLRAAPSGQKRSAKTAKAEVGTPFIGNYRAII